MGQAGPTSADDEWRKAAGGSCISSMDYAAYFIELWPSVCMTMGHW